MRRVGAGLLGLVLAAGCEPPSASLPPLREPEEIHADYAAQAAAVTRSGDQAMVWVDCGSAPRERRACGLISEEMLAQPALGTFIVSACREPSDAPVSEMCIALFQEKVHARFHDRYDHADPDAVQRACAAKGCQTVVLEELQWMQVHNDTVMAETTRKLDQIVREHGEAQEATATERSRRAAEDQAWRARRRAIGEALQAAGQSFQQPSATPGTMEVATGGCSSDYQCRYGQHCIKPQFSSQGTCATVVNDFGTPTSAPPRPDSVQIGGRGNCRFNTDCPIGFRCEKGFGGLTGNCMK